MTPFTTGAAVFLENTLNQAIMSKGEKVDFKRAWHASAQAMAYQAMINAASSSTNLTPLGVGVDITSSTFTVACVDNGSSKMTKEEVEKQNMLEFKCSINVGF